MFSFWLCKLKRTMQISRLVSLLVITGLFGVGVAVLQAGTAQAVGAAGVYSTINYQGRLLTSTGAVAADGTYNMEFQIWQDGNGCVTGCTSANAAANNGGTLKWTEDWVYGTGSPDNRVTVKNGYFSVTLGSLTSLSGVNFNWDTLYLTTDIGNTTTAASFGAAVGGTAGGDGYMIPFKRMAANPYALNSAQLGGLTSSQYTQLGQGIQAASTTGTTALIGANQTSTGTILDLQKGGSDVLLVDSTGSTLFKPNSDSTAALVVDKAGTTTKVFSVDTSNSRIGIGNIAPAYAVDATGSINASVSLKVAGTDVCTTSGCTVASTSGIKNQNSAQQVSSNFWIDGTGRADTGLQSPSLDVGTGTLSIGATNASAVNIGRASQQTTIPGVLILNGTTTNASAKLSIGGALNSTTTTTQYGIFNQFDVNPQGASLNAVYGNNNVPNIASSSLNISSVIGIQAAISTGSGYTGTIAAATGVYITAPTIGGANLFTAYRGIVIATNGVNGGNTTGTITNTQLSISGTTIGAGTGGTENNYGINLTQPNASGGTTNNYGLYIQGNGGGTVNYSIYNSSTAPSYFAGSVAANSLTQNSNTVCDSSSNCTNYLSSGTGVQLQGTTPGTAQGSSATGNFYVGGTGIAGVALQAPSFDTASSATLSVGATNASALTIGKVNQVTTFAGEIAISNTDTTANSARVSLAGTLNSSATASQYGFSNQQNFNPSGGNVSNIYGLNNTATLSGSAYNVTAGFFGTVTQIATTAGYTGQVANGYGLLVNAPTIAGSQLIPNYTGAQITLPYSTANNNTGNITGTITNLGLYLNGGTAGAGTGGVLTNTAIKIVQPSGTGGTTSNYGLYLTGAGASTTNYSIYNASTAASYFAGDLRVNTTSNPSAYQLNVNGTAAASTSVLTPAVDVASAGTLSVGASTATTVLVGTATSAQTSGPSNNVYIGSSNTGSVNITAGTTVSLGGPALGTVLLQSSAGTWIGTGTNTATALLVYNSSNESSLDVGTINNTTNLALNGSFEKNATGWGSTGTGASVAQYSTSAANIYSGLDSLAITLGSSGATGAQITAAGLSGSSLAAGTYTLSFYAKGGASLSGLAASFSGGGTCTLSSTTVSTGGFQRYTCTVTTTGATTSVNITSTTTGQTMYLDGVLIQSGSTASAYGIGTVAISGIQTSPSVFQSASNSTSAFQVQDSSGNSLLTADTLNGNLNLAANTTINSHYLSVTGTTTGNYQIDLVGTVNTTNSSQYSFDNEAFFNPNVANANIWGQVNNPTVITGTNNNVANLIGTQTAISTGAGFTGTVASGTALNVAAPTLAGTNKIATYNGEVINTNSVNGGNTSGTIANTQLAILGVSAGAGTGGTVNNYGLNLTQPSGSGGTTNNYGLYIQGAGGGTTNYSLFDASTAASVFTGTLQVGVGSSATGNLVVANGTNGFTSTIQGNTSTSASYTTVLPAAIGSAGQCLAVASVASPSQTLGYATCAGGGGGVTLQAAVPTVADTGGLWVSGNVRAGTAVVTPTIRPAADSTTAIQIQNAAGTATVMAVDTTNSRINIGTNGTETAQLYVGGSLASGATGSVSTGTSTSPRSIYVQGHYAYTTNYSTNTLGVYDVSNPASPASVGSVSTGASSSPSVVTVQGRYAYVILGGTYSLGIYDISNPTTPSAVGSIVTGQYSGADDVYVQGRYAYVVNQSINNLVIIDVSNPATPVIAGSVSTGSGPSSVFVQGRYAYVTNSSSNTLTIYDVSNPASPVSAGASVSTGVTSQPTDIYVQGRYAYVANINNNTLGIFDVSNPGSPSSAGSVSTGATPRQLFVQGRYAYVTHFGANAIGVYDISVPGSAASVGTIPTGTGTGPNGIYVQGRYVYTANQSNSTLGVYDAGGAYLQQLEAGGAEVGTLAVDSNASVSGSLSVTSGLSAGSATIQGSASVGGSFTIQTSNNAANALQILSSSNVNALTVNTTTNTAALVGLSSPGTLTMATATTGGSIAASTTDYYVVTAVDAYGGETVASPENFQATGAGTATNTITPSWSAVPGALSYKVYRGTTAGNESVYFTTTSASYTDTGSAGTAGTPPTAGSSGTVHIASTGVNIQSQTGSTAAFQVQNSAGTPIFLVDTSTNLSGNILTNGGFENGTTGATPTNWSGVSSATVIKNVTAPYHYGGLASGLVTTPATSGAGINTTGFSSSQSSGTYTLSFYAEWVSGITSSSSFSVVGTNITTTACTSGVTLVNTGFQRITCNVPATGSFSNISITQNVATASQWYIDAVQLVSGSNATPAASAGAIQLRGTVDSPVVFEALSNSTTAFQIQNAAGTSNLFVADTLNNTLNLGLATAGASVLNAGAVGTTAFASTLNLATSTGATQTINVGSTGSGTAAAGTLVNIQGGTGASAVKIGTNGAGTVTIDSGTTGAINIGTGASAKTITIGGTSATNTIVVGPQNSTATTNGIIIGSTATTSNPTLLNLSKASLASETAANCTTTVNDGAIYYSTASAAIRGCVNGGWEDVVTTSGMGIILYGVVPDSATGSTQGDLVGAAAYNSGPCKVYLSATAQVSWNSCVVYSAGRKQLVTAGSATVSASTNTYQNLCLATVAGAATYTGTPLLLTTTSASDTTVGEPTWSVNNPILCLATIKTGTTASTVAAIYDTRVYTTDTKSFATLATASAIGTVVKSNGSTGQYGPITATTDLAVGVLGAYSGTVSTTTPNAIIVTQGPIAIKATAGSIGAVIQSNAAATGYTLTGSAITGSIYGNIGIAQTTYSGSATNCTAATACYGSLFTMLNIR